MRDRNHNNYRVLAEVPMPGCPLTEIVGNKRVLIENHKGIIAYGCNCICVRTSIGVIHVDGSALELKCISKDRVIIVGQIKDVRFSNGG